MVLVLKEIWSQQPDSIIPSKLLLSPLSCTPQQPAKLSEVTSWELTPLTLICGVPLVCFKSKAKQALPAPKTNDPIQVVIGITISYAHMFLYVSYSYVFQMNYFLNKCLLYQGNQFSLAQLGVLGQRIMLDQALNWKAERLCFKF